MKRSDILRDVKAALAHADAVQASNQPKRKRPEQGLHIAVAQFLRVALRPPTFWTSIDHASGMKAGKLAGALRKARGVKAGLPDILVMKDSINTCVIGIELKATKGSLSPAQTDMATRFAECNAHYRVARSVEDVDFILRSFGVPLHAKLS